MRSFIKNTVFNLINKHNTNNPFEIASAENIIIIKEPLGSIYGYYNKKYRQQFIHINCDIDELTISLESELELFNLFTMSFI